MSNPHAFPVSTRPRTLLHTPASYGSLARFWSIERLKVVSDKCVVGFGGEHSDMQAISDFLDELVRDDKIADDGFALTAPEVHSYLTRVLYNRRNKMNPLWNTVVVSGLKPDGTECVGTHPLLLVFLFFPLFFFHAPHFVSRADRHSLGC